MNYFIDTEFLEGVQEPKWLILKGRLGNWLIGKPKPTIDLISIGIVEEDTPMFSNRIGKTDKFNRGREYYAISKDFNLKEAWNRYQMKQVYGDARNRYPDGVKEYWIRENVLKPIWIDLFLLYEVDFTFLKGKAYDAFEQELKEGKHDKLFTFKSFKALVNRYGKTNKQIAEEIKEFCKLKVTKYGTLISSAKYPGGFAFTPDEKLIFDREEALIEVRKRDEEERNRNVPMFRVSLLEKEVDVTPTFYAYYADYDWVAFCWLFGNMMDLPKGFPMYCNDLKQMLDEKVNSLSTEKITEIVYGKDVMKHDVFKYADNPSFNVTKLNSLKLAKNYPKQENEHSALDDARWNKELYKFLKNLK